MVRLDFDLFSVVLVELQLLGEDCVDSVIFIKHAFTTHESSRYLKVRTSLNKFKKCQWS